MRSVTEVVQILKLVLNGQNNLEKYGSARYLFNKRRTPHSKTVLDTIISMKLINIIIILED